MSENSTHPIALWLFELFRHCPSFSRKKENNEAVRNYLHLAVIKAEQEIGNHPSLSQYLIETPYQQLLKFFQQHPFLEIFYLINSLGEYKNGNKDGLHRTTLNNSVQSVTGVTENIVLKKMIRLCEEDLLLSHHFQYKAVKSSFYLSHDIDSINGALLQDGLWALKKGRIDVMFKVFFQALFQRPEWMNMDLIMRTESEYGYRSAFYWLVNKGRIDARQSNADYYIDDPEVQKNIESVLRNGFECGLHKSLSKESFKQELTKLPFKAEGNRYHYLKFSLPGGYDAIGSSGLLSDASLGFAEHYGFRNNYGFPFHPFHVTAGKPYGFVEIPLHVMDGTFERYMKVPVDKTAETVISFLEKNKQDALISILWHNTFFTNYKFKGYLQEYRKILAYLYESQFSCKSLRQITDEFTWKTLN